MKDSKRPVARNNKKYIEQFIGDLFEQVLWFELSLFEQVLKSETTPNDLDKLNYIGRLIQFETKKL